jgi:hypothetical protein
LELGGARPRGTSARGRAHRYRPVSVETFSVSGPAAAAMFPPPNPRRYGTRPGPNGARTSSRGAASARPSSAARRALSCALPRTNHTCPAQTPVRAGTWALQPRAERPPRIRLLGHRLRARKLGQRGGGGGIKWGPRLHVDCEACRTSSLLIYTVYNLVCAAQLTPKLRPAFKARLSWSQPSFLINSAINLLLGHLYSSHTFNSPWSCGSFNLQG